MRFVHLGQRKFITLIGGAATTWPLMARAQQANRMRRVAALWPFNEGDAEGQAQFSFFQQGLRELGWANIRIESRWSGGNIERTRAYAAELNRSFYSCLPSYSLQFSGEIS
jgi:putative ABC transport system substrate-binding protein